MINVKFCKHSSFILECVWKKIAVENQVRDIKFVRTRKFTTLSTSHFHFFVALHFNDIWDFEGWYARYANGYKLSKRKTCKPRRKNKIKRGKKKRTVRFKNKKKNRKEAHYFCHIKQFFLCLILYPSLTSMVEGI
jgi:hypothetical protein